jgi:hypothetical protein
MDIIVENVIYYSLILHILNKLHHKFISLSTIFGEQSHLDR